jgi:hypothetical protein
MVSIKLYAPVLITTLNRYKHFKECLESLEQCTGADKTDVYVALDYPPSEKYFDGWKKIDNYLNKKESSNGFRKLIVIRRNHNYGIGTSDSNGACLFREMIVGKYDRYINTEDDNVFSPNFLDYMNQTLETFMNDENCLAVCGYNYDIDLFDYPSNIYLSYEYSSWGTGFWVKKVEDSKKYRTIENVKSILSSWKKIWVLFKHEPRLLNTLLLNVAINRTFGDTMRVCRQYLEGKYSVFPVVSKVRNNGFDGSGMTIFKKDDKFVHQRIDDKISFMIDEIDHQVLKNNQEKVENYFKRSLLFNFVILVRVFIYWLIKVDILSKEQKRRNQSLYK